MYYVYILASRKKGALYIGVTSDLVKRVYEHKSNLAAGFTEKYNVHNLVYFEVFDQVEDAIATEETVEKVLIWLSLLWALARSNPVNSLISRDCHGRFAASQ